MNRLKRIVQHCKDYGIGPYFAYVFLELVNRVLFFKILVGMKLSTSSANPDLVSAQVPFPGRFLTSAELEHYGTQPHYELDTDFLKRASQNGHRCYGFFDQGKLVSYGWFTRNPVQFLPGVDLHFDPEYIYMFKGFTLNEYRGKRLHAIGMVRAMQEMMKEKNARGLVSYIDATNFPSLKSVYRLGYERFGYCVVLKIGGALLTWASPQCRVHKFGLKKAAENQIRFLSLSGSWV